LVKLESCNCEQFVNCAVSLYIKIAFINKCD
ncbi:hypothetical protein T06_14247, partial [Trichinella sp. T6]